MSSTAVAPVTGVKKTVSAEIQVEAWFEYDASLKEAMTKGHRRISLPNDPRWEDELMKPPFNGDLQGYLQVAEVTRVDGEIVKARGIKGFVCHMNVAREFLQQFHDLVIAGSESPWDQERSHRDEKERLEKAKREGREEELQVIREALMGLMARPIPAETPKGQVKA